MKYTIEVEELFPTHRLTKDETTFRAIDSFDSFDLLEGDLVFEDYLTAKHLAEKINETEVDGKKAKFNSPIHTLGEPSIEINFYRVNKPQQKYFSKEELHNVLKAGDDSKNNSLVVDFDGYVKLVDFGKNEHKNAVRYETFIAGNGYVGEAWTEEQLNDVYESLLQGWHRHLNRNGTVYVEYNDGTSALVSIKRIENLLQNNY